MNKIEISLSLIRNIFPPLTLINFPLTKIRPRLRILLLAEFDFPLRPLQATNPKLEFIQCFLLRILTFQMNQIDQSGVRLIFVFVINICRIKPQSEPQMIHMRFRHGILIQHLDRRLDTVAVLRPCIQIDRHTAHNIS